MSGRLFQVSPPGSPLWATVWNFHAGLPVSASNALMPHRSTR